VGWQRLVTHAFTARLPDAAMARKIFDVTSALAGAVAMYAFIAPSIESSQDLGAFLESELEEFLR
jgi:hypothetical protein